MRCWRSPIPATRCSTSSRRRRWASNAPFQFVAIGPSDRVLRQGRRRRIADGVVTIAPLDAARRLEGLAGVLRRLRRRSSARTRTILELGAGLDVAARSSKRRWRKNGLDKEKIRAMVSKETFETINGKVKFDGVQNAITPTAFVQYQKGKLQIIWPARIADRRSTSRRTPGRRRVVAPCRCSDTLLSGQLLFAALVTGSLYALVALGLNLVYGTMRMLNVAHGEVVMLGAYAAFWAFTLLGLSPLSPRRWSPRWRRCWARAVPRRVPPPAAPMRRRPMPAGSKATRCCCSSACRSSCRTSPRSRSRRTTAAYAYLDDVGPRRQRGDDRQPAGRARRRRRRLHRRRAGSCRRSVVGLAMRAVIERREAAAIVGVDVDRVQRSSFALGFGSAALAGALCRCWSSSRPSRAFRSPSPPSSSSSWAAWAT